MRNKVVDLQISLASGTDPGGEPRELVPPPKI